MTMVSKEALWTTGRLDLQLEINIEPLRILSHDGSLVVGFIKKNNQIVSWLAAFDSPSLLSDSFDSFKDEDETLN